MGSLIVPQGRLLTQHFVRNKMGWMESLLRGSKSKATCEYVGSSEEQETEFSCFHLCALLISSCFRWMISILIKQPFLVLVWILEIQNSGAGSSVKTFLQAVMLFQIYRQSASHRSKREPGAGFWSYPQLLLARWMNCFVPWPAWTPAAAFQPSALALQEMQLSGLVSVWKEPFLCEIFFSILFLSKTTPFPKFNISQHTPSSLFLFYFWFWVIFVPFCFFLSFSWAAEVAGIVHCPPKILLVCLLFCLAGTT